MGMDFRGLWTREINVALRDLSSLSTLEDFGVCRVAASALGRYWAWSAKGCRDPAVRMYHSACVLFSFLFCSTFKLELDGRCLSMQCQSCKSKFLLF